MAEHYQPTAEEMESAEALMLPIQAELSKKRVGVSQKLQEMGVNGMLIFDAAIGDGSDEDPKRDEIRGELNGHDIRVATGGNGYHLGSIDWKYMHPTQAKALWEKYAYIAKLHPMQEIRKAQEQLHAAPTYSEQELQAAELLKGIL